MKTINTLLFCLLILAILFISACSSSNQNQSSRQGNKDSQNFRGNLTDEQRQQMIEQRTQMMTQLCSGKNEGDSCIVESPRGNTGNREGICKFQDEKFLCIVEFDGNFNRSQFPNRDSWQGSD